MNKSEIVEKNINDYENELRTKITIIGITETAKLSGERYQNIYNWMKGKVKFSIYRMLKIGKSLGV